MNQNSDPTVANLSMIAWVSRFSLGFLALIAAQAFVLSVILKTPYTRILLPVVWLSIPAPFSGALMYQSRRGGRLRTGLFLTGVNVLILPFGLVLDYSACRLGYLSASTALGIMPFLFLAVILASVLLYSRLRKKAMQRIG